MSPNVLKALAAVVAANNELLSAISEAANDSNNGQTDDPLVDYECANIPRTTWRAAGKSGALKLQKVGRKWLARKSEVARWIATLPTPKTVVEVDSADAFEQALKRAKGRK